MEIPPERKCDQCETREATACAALTDSSSVLLAHRLLCSPCAQALFSIKVNQVSREEKMRVTVSKIRAQSTANERVTDLDGLNGGESDG